MRRALAVVLFFGLAAAAQAQEIRGGYLGVAVGSFDYSEDGGDLGVGISDSTSAYRVFGGYQINSNYAVELGWGATGDIKEGFRVVDPFFGDVSLDIAGEYEILTLRAVAMAPLSRMNIFGGAGYYDATLDVSFRYQDAFETLTASEETSDSGATIVGGIQFEFEHVALRGEYEWFDTDGDVDASTISFAALFRF